MTVILLKKEVRRIVLAGESLTILVPVGYRLD